MKFYTILFLFFTIFSAYCSPLAEIKSLSKSQQTLLYGIIDDKEKADKSLIEAQANIISSLNSLNESQKALTEAKLNEVKLKKSVDGWKARSDWFEADNIKQKEKAQKAISQTNKFRVVVWVIVSIVSILATILVIKIFGTSLQFMGLYGFLIPAGTFIGTFVTLAGLIEIFTRI